MRRALRCQVTKPQSFRRPLRGLSQFVEGLLPTVSKARATAVHGLSSTVHSAVYHHSACCLSPAENHSWSTRLNFPKALSWQDSRPTFLA